MDDRWLSVEEIAEYLGVSKNTMYSWVSTKGMPGHRVGRFWKFTRDEVDAWVWAGEADGEQEPCQECDGASKPQHLGRTFA